MRLPLPAQAPSWLQGVLRSIENAFREIMPAPFRLKSYATADLPDAADFLGGLVFDSTTAAPKISTGTAWSALATQASVDAKANLAGGNTFTGLQALSNALVVRGFGAPTSGQGLEFNHGSSVAGQSEIFPFNRDAGTFLPLRFRGSQMTLAPGGTTNVVVTTTGVSCITATTASAANLYQAASGSELLRSTSSARYKTEITDLDDARADRLLQLRPVRYRSLAGADDPTWSFYGLVAEEVAAIDPRYVHYGFQEDQYERVVVDPGSPAIFNASGEMIQGEIPPTYEWRVKAGEVKRPDGIQYERLTIALLQMMKRVRNVLVNQNQRIKALEDRLVAAKIP